MANLRLEMLLEARLRHGEGYTREREESMQNSDIDMVLHFKEEYIVQWNVECEER